MILEMPSLEAWLRDAVAGAEQSGQHGVRPVLEAIASAARHVRQASWNADAAATEVPPIDASRPSPRARG